MDRKRLYLLESGSWKVTLDNGIIISTYNRITVVKHTDLMTGIEIAEYLWGSDKSAGPGHKAVVKEWDNLSSSKVTKLVAAWKRNPFKKSQVIDRRKSERAGPSRSDIKRWRALRDGGVALSKKAIDAIDKFDNRKRRR